MQTYDIFQLEITVKVSRRTDRYSSDTLAKVETTEEFPLTHSDDLAYLRDEVYDRMMDTQTKVGALLGVRGRFEVQTLALESGETS